MITYQLESVTSIRLEGKALLWEHYDEVALYRDAIPLDPDWGKYEYMEQESSLVAVGARDDGRLIGYSVFFLNWHIHYKRSLYAANDVLFLEKAYRTKSSAGIRLIKESEKMLRARGVERILFHVKLDHDFRKILHRLGYFDEEVIVGKLIREG